MARGIVFRREKPSLGVGEDFLGAQVIHTMSFVEGKNSYSYSLVACYYPLYQVSPQITFWKIHGIYLCMSSTREAVGSPPQSRAESNGENPSVDELYGVFANRRRRYAIHYLQQVDGRTDFGEMAEQIAAWEHGKTRQEVTSNERKYVYSALQQRHLPKMHDIGLVEFNKRDGIVEPTADLDEIDVYAEIVEKGNVPWGVYFPSLSAVHSVLLALVGFNVAPLTMFSEFEWALLFVSSFLVSSLVFLYDTKRMKLGDSGAPPEAEQQ